MATVPYYRHGFVRRKGSFQSIGVTKEWRLVNKGLRLGTRLGGFQSIGVTKEWRPSVCGIA